MVNCEQLKDVCGCYVDFVERGVLTEKRADAHDKVIAALHQAGIPFRGRRQARDIAFEIWYGVLCKETFWDWLVVWHREMR